MLSRGLLLGPPVAQMLTLLRRLSTASSPGPISPTPGPLPPEEVFSSLFPECINDYSPEAAFPFGDKLEGVEELSERDGHAS